MTDSEKLTILREAFRKACKWIHDNPPGNLDMYFERPNYIQTLACNANYSDGSNWQALFISETLKEMEINDTLV